MKKLVLVFTILLANCAITDSFKEVNIDNENCIGVRRFKVLQAIDHNTGLAYECFTPDCSDYYYNNLDFIFRSISLSQFKLGLRFTSISQGFNFWSRRISTPYSSNKFELDK